ncbi:MAG: S26 family signal peptidase [Clostridia bacterium]|nr:S26 family signal peptidase [Clostridia bacterium]
MSEVNMSFVPRDAAVVGPEMEALFAKGEQVTLQVSGDSMRPTLKPRRDAVLLAPSRGEPFHKWDILLFRSGRSASGYALHRVARMSNGKLTMNGDAQVWTEDISPGDVVAKAIVLIRNGKPVDPYCFRYRLFAAVWSITRPARFRLFAIWRGIKQFIGSEGI